MRYVFQVEIGYINGTIITVLGDPSDGTSLSWQVSHLRFRTVDYTKSIAQYIDELSLANLTHAQIHLNAVHKNFYEA